MVKHIAIAVTATVLLSFSSSVIHAGFPPAPVFDGKSLAGWHVLGGGEWRVDRGDIVGTVRDGADGWLVLDRIFGTAGLEVSFECRNCEPSVMVRTAQTGNTTSGVDVALFGSTIGSMTRITVDGQGKVIDRKPMPPFVGVATGDAGPNYLTTGGCLPIPCAGIKDAHGGGGGAAGRMPQAGSSRPDVPLQGWPDPALPYVVPGLAPALSANGLNQFVLTMGSDLLTGSFNDARLPPARMDTGNAYGQIALHVAGPNGAELRIKKIAVYDYTTRKAGLAAEITDQHFRKHVLTDIFYAEGAAIGDINHDGHMDVTAGPFYYLGPDFKEAHEIYPPATINIAGAEYPGGPPVPLANAIVHGNYPPAFMSWVYDFNSDGWPDILMVMAFGPRPTFSAHLFINPKGVNRHWDNYQVVPVITTEANTFVDVDGDGKPELTMQTATRPDWSDAEVGYAKPDWSDPTKPWKFIAVSEKGRWSGHGLAAGDVNGDGRQDLVSPAGWWEQPPQGTAGLWKNHPARLTRLTGGAEMFVYDVNGDGIPDIITSVTAHGPELAWYEQKKDGSFQMHLIMGAAPVPMDQRKDWEETDKSVAFTELHAMSMADINGDGLKDIVTGKRWYSHGYRYDEEDDVTDPPVLYVFQLVRKPGNKVEWIPRLINNRHDAAVQVAVADINGDGTPDIVTSGRKGTAIFFNTNSKR